MNILALNIEPSSMNYVWVQNHWDHHLKGLCRFNNKLCVFEIDNVHDGEGGAKVLYKIYSLNFVEKLKWLLRKKLFEIFVGYHWTYINGKRGPAFQGVSWKFNLYYGLKGFKKLK